MSNYATLRRRTFLDTKHLFEQKCLRQHCFKTMFPLLKNNGNLTHETTLFPLKNIFSFLLKSSCFLKVCIYISLFSVQSICSFLFDELFSLNICSRCRRRLEEPLPFSARQKKKNAMTRFRLKSMEMLNFTSRRRSRRRRRGSCFGCRHRPRLPSSGKKENRLE